MKWEVMPEVDYHHTAETYYAADGFRIWKGKHRIVSTIYSANEWHLERLSDNKILHSAKTAKECKGALEYCIKRGYDIETMNDTGIGTGVRFNEDCSDYYYIIRKGKA